MPTASPRKLKNTADIWKTKTKTLILKSQPLPAPSLLTRWFSPHVLGDPRSFPQGLQCEMRPPSPPITPCRSHVTVHIQTSFLTTPPVPPAVFFGSHQELSHSGLHRYSQLNTSSFTIKYSYIYAQSAQQTPILPSDTCCILYSPLTSWLHSFLGLI